MAYGSSAQQPPQPTAEPATDDVSTQYFTAHVRAAVFFTKEAVTTRALLQPVHLPMARLHLCLSANVDYTHLPTMTKLEPSITIAGGVSAPEVITMAKSTGYISLDPDVDNGERFKQLIKGGNDDIRQDAIMVTLTLSLLSLKNY
ncbi:Uu.00g134170.m01.CDS01 [Anthostomella pinea]|uniref:Uu.00g134170.m01.CDS01 n=1 Tax=Anthostomella pinea TaxID=933095 RepID=A0AAI8VNW2_9PEZI|nr:Uu.00g134170.m01.CDS01 [Anthostomella pinea]